MKVFPEYYDHQEVWPANSLERLARLFPDKA
jgi:hypothetical protein